MNKIGMVGIGIFSVLVIALLAAGLMSVRAQNIISEDSNSTETSILYYISIGALNLSNDHSGTYDNATNITYFTDTIIGVDYSCTFNLSDPINMTSTLYGRNGSTYDLNATFMINQTLLTTMTDGIYRSALDCMYMINKTITTGNMTAMTNMSDNSTYNITESETVIEFSAIHMASEKQIAIDTGVPIISIDHASEVYNLTGNETGNLTVRINFNVTETTGTRCVLTLDGQNGINGMSNETYIQRREGTYVLYSTASNISVSGNISSGDRPYNLTCTDEMGHISKANSSIRIISHTMPETILFDISVSKPIFDLGEIGQYMISANNNSNVSITICPIATGWVQCFMAPTFVNDTYPKIQALPYTNKTGRYVIEGIMRYKNNTIARNITYETANTLTAVITASKTSGVVGDVITFNATASAGIGPYNFRWTMPDGTRFTGTGAYRNFSAAGTFRVNLSVNDTLGNSYSTYVDVTIRNKYTLSVIVIDTRNNARIPGAEVNVNSNDKTTDSSGTASFVLAEKRYDVVVIKENFARYSADIDLNSDKTVYINLTFQDSVAPKITLLTNDGFAFSKDSVKLKFKAEDTGNIACSLFTAESNNSWFTLKDSGDGLLSNTEYTFEVKDLDVGEYKWKIECFDSSSNKAYSPERRFTVTDAGASAASEYTDRNTDEINKALDNMNKLSGDESSVVDVLGIKSDLKNLLDRINRVDRDIHDLAYRRDLTEDGRKQAQKNLTDSIENMKYSIPMSVSISDSKTFVKYVHDEDLKSILDEYQAQKSLRLDKRLFLESTKSVQSKVIISTRVRNVELFYLDGRSEHITLVTKDIKVAKPEDEGLIRSSNSMTFVESIPKTITQSTKQMRILTKDYTIVKEDPMIEFPPSVQTITYYINGSVDPEQFQESDTVLIEKDLKSMASTTGFSVLGMDSLSDVKVKGQGIMIIIIVLLVLFYIVINFDIIDKVRAIDLGFVGPGSKKKVSFIRVLVNDAVDYLGTDDYDKASLIYREIKLTYEEANEYVKSQVYDESFDLCNQLDLHYAMKTLDRIEVYLAANDRNNALMEFERLEGTYNKLGEKYQTKIDVRFKKILPLMKGHV